VSTGFVIIPPDDVVGRLREAFPDLWAELLEQAFPDASFMMYSAFAELLLQRRDDEALWERAYRFFDQVSERGGTDSKEVLRGGTFERLCDSDISDTIEKRLGRQARALFRSCRL
jgi:hypothetical protein